MSIFSKFGNWVGNTASQFGNWVGNTASQFGNWLVKDALPSAANWASDVAWNATSKYREYNEAQKELEYQRTLPETQMQNLKDAGINTAMFYGSPGSAAAGNYTPNEAQNSASEVFRMVQDAFTGAMNMIGQYQTLRNSMANMDKITEQARDLHLKNNYTEAFHKVLGIGDGGTLIAGYDPSEVSIASNGYKLFSSKADIAGYKSIQERMLAEYLRLLHDPDYKIGGSRKGLPTLAELELLMNQAQRNYYDRQGSYLSAMTYRLNRMFDPKLESLLGLAGDLAGNATTILTRGIAGKSGLLGGNNRTSPHGYLNYGHYINGGM